MEKTRLQFERIRADERALQYSLRRMTELEKVSDERWMDDDYQDERYKFFKASHEANVTLFADIHYLLVTLEKLETFFRLLEAKLSAESELKAVRANYDSLLRDSNEFRNFVEHIDKELRRGTSDLGNLAGTLFTFNGRTFDIGPKRQREVESFFSDLVTACEAIAGRQRQAKGLPP